MPTNSGLTTAYRRLANILDVAKSKIMTLGSMMQGRMRLKRVAFAPPLSLKGSKIRLVDPSNLQRPPFSRVNNRFKTSGLHDFVKMKPALRADHLLRNKEQFHQLLESQKTVLQLSITEFINRDLQLKTTRSKLIKR